MVLSIALFDTLDPSLTPRSVDWARPGLAVFPDEATDSNVVRVVMPEELRKVYDGLKKEADGSVEIPNPLFAYKFPEGIEENGKTFKVSEESSLEGSKLQSFAPLVLVLIRARRID